MQPPLSLHFEPAGRVRPVDLLAPGAVPLAAGSRSACPQPAPSFAAEALLAGPVELTWRSGEDALTAAYDGSRVSLRVVTGTRTTEHRSRRAARVPGPVEALGLTVTGRRLVAFTRTEGRWTARGLVDIGERGIDPHDEAWLAGLHVEHRGEVAGLRAGGFGQLGLRDLRLVTNTGGSAYSPGGRILLTATSAGPGFFDTAHTSVWELDPADLSLVHRADLFFRRDGKVYGDHSTHLVRDGDDWLVATSTWGDFRRERDDRVGVTVARSDADLLTGRHVLDSEPLTLPTTGLGSVGVWDPHLVRTGHGWLVGYVSARRYFDFHPVLATGPALSELTLRAAAAQRRATEGTTLIRSPDGWRVLASDGRDNPRGLRARYPVLDLDLREVGTLDAPYPSNLPWPTLVPTGGQWLLVGFDGESYGGSLLGYGTHGAVVIARGEPQRRGDQSREGSA